MKSFFIISLLFAQNCFSNNPSVNLPIQNDFKKIVIDSISIERNWLTWDAIILNELTFKTGDSVTRGQIDTSITKIWNINNFADVKYAIHIMPDGKTHLEITALDALKLKPILSLNFNPDEYYIGLGAEDANFIGSNILLKVKAGFRSTGNDWDFKVGVPRQLLYKNSTLDFGYIFGNEVKYHWKRVVNIDEKGTLIDAYYRPLMAAPYKKTEVYGTFGNPWHLDFKYRFSPNLKWKFLHQKIRQSLVTTTRDSSVMVSPYTLNIFELNISESHGMVNARRHRKNGYKLQGGGSFYFGLDAQTPSHQAFTLEAEYHKTFNALIQFSGWYRTGYTNTDIKALQFCKGSDDIIGHRTGEIHGKAFYAAYLGVHLTWINRNWLSLENAYFVNFGKGADDYTDVYTFPQNLAIGSTLRFQVPAIPVLFVQFTFSYAGPGSQWLNIKNY